jgi:molybdate transport system substrate-binding protein
MGCNKPGDRPLTIAAAANLQYVLDSLTTEFTAQTGIVVEVIFASSGKLTAQITAGAPYDLFLSADERYPAELAKIGLTAGAPLPYARGQLAIWTNRKEIPLHPDSLLSSSISHLAVANPATAPYGKAAMDYLQNRGYDAALNSKLVLGESIGQANQFVYSAAADVGITAYSTVLKLPTGGSTRWVLLQGSDYPPVIQSGVVLKSNENQEKAARRFLEFLQRENGQSILSKFGYLRSE